MILYELNCSGGHAFDAWFKDADNCDRQLKRKIVECPVCGDTSVAKALMAPRIGKSAKTEIAPALTVPAAVPAGVPALRPNAADGGKMAMMAANMRETLSEIRKQIEANCDYVGGNFAEEARKIHYGETEARGIYGEASDEQHQELVEEGVEIARIPWLPRGDA